MSLAPEDPILEAIFSGLDLLGPGGPEVARYLAHGLELRPGLSLLEVACGTGRTACQLAREFGVAIVAMDLASWALRAAAARVAREKLEARIQLRRLDMRELPRPFGGRGFDAVLCEGAAHLVGLGAFARSVAPLLKPGGKLALTHLCYVVEPERVPADVRAFLSEDGEGLPAVGSLEQALQEVAEAGYERGFAYPLPREAYELYYGPVRDSVRRLRAQGMRSPVLDRFEREIEIYYGKGGFETAAYVAIVAEREE